MSGEHPIEQLCHAFDVSRSGYYDWCQRQEEPGPRALEDAALRPRIAALHQEHEGTYGSPRIQRELAYAGQRHGRNRIARLMREQGLSGQLNARFKVVTTDSNHDLPIAPNRLREAVATRPNQIWVGDIIYIKTAQGWLYLAAIMDLYSRRIVGWGMSERIDTALVLMAWQMAQEHRQAPNELIFHSDRGVQYASAEYRQALRAQGALASMSRRACCYDNAARESFWSTLKRELVYRRDFLSHEQARSEIFAYIETRRLREPTQLTMREPLNNRPGEDPQIFSSRSNKLFSEPHPALGKAPSVRARGKDLVGPLPAGCSVAADRRKACTSLFFYLQNTNFCVRFFEARP